MSTKQAAHLERGAQAEAMAGEFLIHKGLHIVQRNFRVRGGEIDLVCRDGATTVFVEVRLRSNDTFGGAAASITSSKQRRLVLAARHWIQRHGEVPCRFDCILMDALDVARIEWIQDAFSAD
jgi:putative endonuclease